ncbi:MAG: SCP2 sterol-binding domain-containing protein [Anaerolineae bacterium]|nr:SCP2 sterol-binding domain-containing protein [Anaerolineae bacterium]
MSVADDIQLIIQKMPGAFLPEKADGLDTSIQLELTGDGGGDWVIKIANRTVTVKPGRSDAPNLTLTMAASDYVAISYGEANPVNLFMAGKIKLQGDMTLALKFPELFNRSRA